MEDYRVLWYKWVHVLSFFFLVRRFCLCCFRNRLAFPNFSFFSGQPVMVRCFGRRNKSELSDDQMQGGRRGGRKKKPLCVRRSKGTKHHAKCDISCGHALQKPPLFLLFRIYRRRHQLIKSSFSASTEEKKKIFFLFLLLSSSLRLSSTAAVSKNVWTRCLHNLPWLSTWKRERKRRIKRRRRRRRKRRKRGRRCQRKSSQVSSPPLSLFPSPPSCEISGLLECGWQRSSPKVGCCHIPGAGWCCWFLGAFFHLHAVVFRHGARSTSHRHVAKVLCKHIAATCRRFGGDISKFPSVPPRPPPHPPKKKKAVICEEDKDIGKNLSFFAILQ